MSNQFKLADGLCYLNHAAVAPWPTCCADAIQSFARQNLLRGASDYPEWLRRERRLRELFRWLINAHSTDEIAILKNTSEALSTVAYGLDWRSGDNIVTFAQEFPSNRVVWQSLRDRGVETRLVELADSSSPEQALMAACDDRTRLVSTSSVQYATGLRIDLERLGRFCTDRGILFCVDAIQSLGALPFDVRRCRADFVMADGHKWMLGPEGVALFYARSEVRDRLRLNQYGWHMLDAVGDYDARDWRVSATATRFECGSPNMLGIHGLCASLELLREVGIDTVAERIEARCERLIERLGEISGLRLLSPVAPDRRAGIVTFVVDGHDPVKLHQRLTERAVICAQRGGGIRFSPHYHTPMEVIDQAVDRLIDSL